MNKRFSLLLLTILAGVVAACGWDDTAEFSQAVLPTATSQATPTLLPGLSTAPPVAADAATNGRFADTANTNAAANDAGATTPNIDPGVTLTPTPTPTATPQPGQRVTLAYAALDEGNDGLVVEHFNAALEQRGQLTPEQVVDALYHLGVAHSREAHWTTAVSVLNELLSVATGNAPAAAYYYLAQAQQQLGEYHAAIEAYRTYLERHPDMAAYVQPRIAVAYTALGQREQAIAAYQAALNSPAHRLTEIDARQQLVEFYLDDQDYAAAIVQYDAIRQRAQTDATRGRMTYLAGAAYLQAGDTAAAHERFLEAVDSYPRAYESYLGLVELVEAGVPVDEFQRGLVDYFAGAYEPAVAAFQRYIEARAAADDFRADAHLYLAWSYEGLGDVEAALQQVALYAKLEPAWATIERAKLLARAGRADEAIATYLDYLDRFPEGEDAPFAAWWAAVLTERQGEGETAVSHYLTLADNYPRYENAPEALFRAGFLQWELGQTDTAVAAWARLSDNYPNSQHTAAALVWLLRTLPEGQVADSVESLNDGEDGGTITGTVDLQQTVRQWVFTSRSADYYALRARDLLSNTAPFTAQSPFTLPDNPDAGRAEAESWLRDRLELEADAPVGQLDPALQNDYRLSVGQKLWQLGRHDEAKRELESLRQDYRDDALRSYQLALFFRDLGLYRSSIIAANTVLALTGTTVFEAPVFIGRLAYPVYYADLILSLAERYAYDPRLQFALVRQESLYESFARSGAAAQGLSQVIPDTGAYIAGQLNWPDYENEDLYKPYVGLNFGAYYLNQQLDAFNGDVHAALAAYNAGPGNAARWYDAAGDDHDEYVEMVNFWETRQYIERIYEGFVIYRYLYRDSG